MGNSFCCHCEERTKPVQERKWIVIKRNCNHSAFNGYHRTYSDYSTVFCTNCHALGRTKANFVRYLKNANDGDFLK